MPAKCRIEDFADSLVITHVWTVSRLQKFAITTFGAVWGLLMAGSVTRSAPIAIGFGVVVALGVLLRLSSPWTSRLVVTHLEFVSTKGERVSAADVRFLEWREGGGRGRPEGLYAIRRSGVPLFRMNRTFLVPADSMEAAEAIEAIGKRFRFMTELWHTPKPASPKKQHFTTLGLGG
jgi:hypothetical protein